MRLPPLYPIADIGTLETHGMRLEDFVPGLLDGGAEILQLRNKSGSAQEILSQAEAISRLLEGTRCVPVMNDRADLALLAGWNAVHLGHKDLPPEAAKTLTPSRVELHVGVSTHTEAQVALADAGPADYVAIGPVFGTATKADAEPVVGLEGVRNARRLTRKPLVAIGGISLATAGAVLEAGADSVAVIGALFVPGQSVAATVQDFLRRLR
jgi:thiamine-phosphate pyrophosphorylase